MTDKQQEPKGTYLRVVEYIKQEIRSGKLKIGSQLPAERALAEIDCFVNNN